MRRSRWMKITKRAAINNKGGHWMTRREYEKQFRDLPDALSATEVAQTLRVNVKTVYDQLHSGAIPSVRVGREYRVAKESLIDYLRSAERRAAK